MSKVKQTSDAVAVRQLEPQFTGKAIGIKWWNGLSYTVELDIVDGVVANVGEAHHGPDLAVITVTKASKLLRDMCNTSQDLSE